MVLRRAGRKNTCVDGIELPAVEKEYLSTGGAVFVFDSATVPAVKQLRHKYLMADCGALNLQVDEIASNLLGQKEVLVTFLELYDRGFIKDKLIKSSAESMRAEKLEGSTPANMLLFGTFHDLLDGGVNEEALLNMLATGYARRCLFGFQTEAKAPTDVSVDELIDSMFDMDTESIVEEYVNKEFIDMDTRYFGNGNIRNKFKEVEEDFLYKYLYEYDSQFEHGLWGAIRESSILKCTTSGHQFHGVPDIDNIQKMPDVGNDMISVMKKHIEIIGEAYPIPFLDIGKEDGFER